MAGALLLCVEHSTVIHQNDTGRAAICLSYDTSSYGRKRQTSELSRRVAPLPRVLLLLCPFGVGALASSCLHHATPCVTGAMGRAASGSRDVSLGAAARSQRVTRSQSKASGDTRCDEELTDTGQSGAQRAVRQSHRRRGRLLMRRPDSRAGARRFRGVKLQGGDRFKAVLTV